MPKKLGDIKKHRSKSLLPNQFHSVWKFKKMECGDLQKQIQLQKVYITKWKSYRGGPMGLEILKITD